MSLTLVQLKCMVRAARGAACSASLPVQGGIMGNFHGQHITQYHGPTLEDCQKVYWTIKAELMADAMIRVLMSEPENPTTRPSLVVYSMGFSDEHPEGHPRIWATQTLQDGYEAITYRQLYRLLIDAYSTMDGYLKGQLPLPLP